MKLLPNSISRFIEKEIDRRSDAKLEKVKAELQGAYSTVKASVDVLTASNSGMRPHIIDAVSALWTNMMIMREKFGGLIGLDSIILADEAQKMFSNETNAKALDFVRPFAGELHTNRMMIEFNTSSLDEHRLFCGDRLWLVFYIYRASILRNAFLISESFEQSAYRDWRTDDGIRQLLGSVLTGDEVAKLRAMRFGGLAAALSRLEGEFLHEATRVMSGSKAMADSLSDMQAMILLQNAKVAERGEGSHS